MIKKLLLQLFVITMLFVFNACENKEEEITAVDNLQDIKIEQQEIFDEVMDESEKAVYNADILQPMIIGSERVIIYGQITSHASQTQITDVDANLVSENKLQPTYINIEDGMIYAVFDGLNANKEYSLMISVVDGEKEYFLENQLVFKTPGFMLLVNDVQKKIDDILFEHVITQENRLLLETQACMKLLGLETDEIGTYGFLTQANIVRLEYSFNSYDSFIDYSHIYGQPTNELLAVLKSILSVSGENTGKDMIREFRVGPHLMTDYAKLVLCEKNYDEFCSDCHDFCGKIDVDQYIYELAKENKQAYETYKELPFIIETQEFEEKYGDSDLSKKQAETEAAKNKAIFSMYQSKWLKTVAVNKEKIIPVAGADDDSISLSTLIALSYMAIDAYNQTGDVFMVRSGYRSYNLQEKIHYKVMQKADIDYWRDLAWYKQRQKVSAVPGFSNHQYGFAIDFEGKYNYGINSFTKYQPELYKFLLKNGSSYGFYRNSSEPWHWAYLGKVFD